MRHEQHGPYIRPLDDPKENTFARTVFDFLRHNVDRHGVVDLRPLFRAMATEEVDKKGNVIRHARSRSAVWATVMFLQRSQRIYLRKVTAPGYHRDDDLYFVTVPVSNENLRWFQ